MKIIFAGTPEAAVPTLDQLVASSHQVVGVLTRPPARQGRGRTLVASPVAERAEELGIPLIESNVPNSPEVGEAIRNLEPELGVVVAYGAILRSDLLQIPPQGWINLHFSELPRWRGAAPVQRAILHQDKSIATSVFQLEPGMDTGPVYSSEVHPLDGTETSGELLGQLALSGAIQIKRVVDQISELTAKAIPQDLGKDNEKITLASRLTKQEGAISFAESAAQTSARSRAVTPNPGAWTKIDGDKLLKLGPLAIVPVDESEGITLGPGEVLGQKNRVLVGCVDGVVQLGQVAPAGKGWMDAASWWRGARLGENTKLGENLEQ